VTIFQKITILSMTPETGYRTLHQSAFLRGGRGGGVGDLKGFLRGGEGDLLIPGAGARGVSVFFLPRPFSLNVWMYCIMYIMK
jgi:hypothetical protein